jgi:hypothetical protein
VKKLLVQDLTMAKAHELLAREGIVVPYRTFTRFCVERLGAARSRPWPRARKSRPEAGQLAGDAPGLNSSRRPGRASRHGRGGGPEVVPCCWQQGGPLELAGDTRLPFCRIDTIWSTRRDVAGIPCARRAHHGVRSTGGWSA